MSESPSRLARRFRAEKLRGTAPHADALLGFLVHVLEAQEPVYTGVRAASWLTTLDDPTGEPRLQWDRLPADEVVALLGGFVTALETKAPAPIAAACRSLSALSAADARDQLRSWIDDRRRDDPSSVSGDAPAVTFVGRVFLQVAAEAFAEQLVTNPREGDRTCSVCGSPPLVGLLRDEPEMKGRRVLVCAVCASEWGFPRATCAGCGTDDRAHLVSHEADSIPHVRLDACRACSSYVKAIDLRRNGRADPFADDLATVELDLWAAEHGLVRLQSNLLGV